MIEHLIDYPFVRDEKTIYPYGEEGAVKVKCWRPGCELDAGDGNFDIGWAEAMGKMVLTEIDCHKLPKPYHERVFYLREWIDPDGKRFGRNNLRIISRNAFTSMLKGYRHEYELGLD